MSWSIWQALRARKAAMQRAEELPRAPRTGLVPAPSLKVLLEIFRPHATLREDEPADSDRCFSERKEAQVP